MSDVTRILQSIDSGNPQAAEELMPLVYAELRRLAAAKMASEKPGQTLQPTALVHEAWLKLVGAGSQEWSGKAHFFGAAAEAMRRILIDKARRKSRLKRGSGQELEDVQEMDIAVEAPCDEVLAVHDALDALERLDPLAARVVKLRYFTGLSIPQIADILEVGERTAHRYWSFARSWLKEEIQSDLGRQD